MTDGVIKKAGKKAAEEARQIAKQAVGEVVEIPKEAVRQTTGLGTSPIVEAMQQEATAPVNPEEIKTQEKKAFERVTNELEQEIAKERLKRAQKAEVPPPQPKPVLGPLVEPTPVPKRGMPPGLAGKQGTKEVMKTPSG